MGRGSKWTPEVPLRAPAGARPREREAAEAAAAVCVASSHSLSPSSAPTCSLAVWVKFWGSKQQPELVRPRSALVHAFPHLCAVHMLCPELPWTVACVCPRLRAFTLRAPRQPAGLPSGPSVLLGDLRP